MNSFSDELNHMSVHGIPVLMIIYDQGTDTEAGKMMKAGRYNDGTLRHMQCKSVITIPIIMELTQELER